MTQSQTRPNPSETSRRMRGEAAYHSGLAAEDQVSAHYEAAGYVPANKRIRMTSGEIDLVVRRGAEVIFVEVKKARTLHDAAHRLSGSQLRRLFNAASEFLAGEPRGLLTPARFDLALVGGDGAIEIRENILPF